MVDWFAWWKAVWQFWFNRAGFGERDRDGVAARARRLRHAIGCAFVEAFMSVVLGLALGRGMAECISTVAARYVFLSAAVLSGVLLCWAVLGVLGWEIQSIDGTTIVEEVNKRWYRGLTIVGFFLMAVSLGIGSI